MGKSHAKKTVAIIIEECTGRHCLACVKNCSIEGAIIFDEEREQVLIDREKCIGCGKCLKWCPNRTIYIKESRS